VKHTNKLKPSVSLFLLAKEKALRGAVYNSAFIWALSLRTPAYIINPKRSRVLSLS
jgi:hypothetical protein